MNHFTYITKHTNGKYYVGRHSTNNIDDDYKGSGKWVRSIKDKSTLHRDILEFYATPEDLLVAEQSLIELHIDQPNNMNFNNSPVGFASGDLNPQCTPEARQRTSERIKGELNPMYGKTHSEEAKALISKATTGTSNPMYGIKHDEEVRTNMSVLAAARNQTAEGKASCAKGGRANKGKASKLKGRSWEMDMTEEAKNKISDSWSRRKKIVCPHCSTECFPNTYSRWHGDACKKA